MKVKDTYYTPPKTGISALHMPAHLLGFGQGQRSRRQSMSMVDMEGLSNAAQKQGEALLDVAMFATVADTLVVSIDLELRKLEESNKEECACHQYLFLLLLMGLLFHRNIS